MAGVSQRGRACSIEIYGQSDTMTFSFQRRTVSFYALVYLAVRIQADPH